MGPPKVLIVDDDAIIRTLLRHTLGAGSYLLFEAIDGNQALEIVDREMPDLILLDIMMPELDGRDVLRRLQAQEHTRHIPVIVVTALTDESEVASSLMQGAVDHISKPFSEVVVRARVQAALRTRTPASPQEPPRKRARRIGVIGAKGGVAVTTTVANLALTMTSPKRSVIAVEMRGCFGTLGQLLGLSPKWTLQSLLEEPRTELSEQRVRNCLTMHNSGLRALLAPPTLHDLRELTAPQAEAILDVLADISDYVLVDLPFPPTATTVAAVQRCDYVVLAVELEATCLASAQAMLKGLTAWGVIREKQGGLLILREPMAGTYITVAHGRQQVSCDLIGVIPPAGESSLLASKSGTPVVFSAPDGAAAMAYSELGARLMAERITALTF